MKKSLFVVLALALFSFSACDEDGTTPVDTTASYLGKLDVKVFDNSINVVSNTPVYLYRNLDDLNNNYYLEVDYTAGSGIAEFGETIEGFYYLRTGRFIFNEWYADTGAVQIIGGQLSKREMYLHK